MERNIDEIVTILNEYWRLIPEENLPTYDEFNRVFPVAENAEKLFAMEAENGRIGVARFGKPDVGLTTLSFIATLADLATGHRIAAVVSTIDEPNMVENIGSKKIIGWSYQ